MREKMTKGPLMAHLRVSLILLLLSLNACAGKNLQVDASRPSEGQAYRVLITNDDGIDSPGVRQLALAIAEFAEVVVVAPEKNESGSSQSSRIMSVRPRLNPVDIGGPVTAFSCNSTPSDCVALGNAVLGQEKPFDLVVSGVNDGRNLGSSYLYSGTIGAAFQALVDGIPAIAVSQARGNETYDASISFTVQVVRSVMSEPLPEGEVLSINVPAGQIAGVRASPADLQAYKVSLEEVKDDAGTYYKPSIHPLDEPHDGFDIQSFRQGYITLSLLKLDRNAYTGLTVLKDRDFIKSWPGGEE